MTDREKLVEMLETIYREYSVSPSKDLIANYLISHGVVVLPCNASADELVGKIDKLERELNAAIADLYEIMADSESDINPCDYCKYAEDGQCHHLCIPFDEKWGWEWRGVQEAEHEND